MNIFFTDLDGTLLDHDTYSLEGSLEGIELLEKAGIPLVPVTSKTFDEVRGLMNFLNLASPFVFENGAGMGIYSEKSGYEYILQSPGIDFLRGLIPLVSEFFSSNINVLNFVSPEELNELTGLGLESSKLALKRKGSLFFLPVEKMDSDMAVMEKLNVSLSSFGAKVTKGGRFYHLIHTDCGKDYGVKKIIEFYKNNGKDPGITGAAGDTFNDISMLKEVDYPYIVKKIDGTWIDVKFKVIKTKGAGPFGFTEAVKDFLIRTAG